MSKLLSIDLNRQSINDAIKFLEQYAKSIDKKADKACEELANIGRDRAEEYYADVPFDEADDPHIKVNVDKEKKTYKVVATADAALGADDEPHGNQIIFAEFGTGAFAGNGHPLAGDYGAEPASWSSTYGTGEYAESRASKGGYWKQGIWHHNGKTHQGYSGTRAMYEAGQLMRQKLVETMRKAFK